MKKPVIGGKPPRFIISIARLMLPPVRNTGSVDNIYNNIYKMAQLRGADNNHPMCIRPEKNNRNQRLFAPIPLVAAITTFIRISPLRILFGLVTNNKKAGAIFCQVRKIKAVELVSLVMMIPPQKCSGAILAFSAIPSIIQVAIFLLSDITPLLRIISEPTLCTIKYTIHLFLADHFDENKVMKDIIFSSNIIHTAGHPSHVNVPNVPRMTPVHIKKINHKKRLFLSY